MSPFLSILITLIAIVITARFIVKKYNPIYVFLISGIIILFVLTILNGHSVLDSKNSTGSLVIDVFAKFTTIFKREAAGSGANIMMITGFAAYMSHIKASNKLASIVSKPLVKFNKPYIILGSLYIVGILLKTMITSHVGLSLLLMTTVYPILIKIGISKLSAAACLLIAGSFDWGPNDSAVVFAAKNVCGIPVVQYFTKYQWVISLCIAISICIFMMIYFKKLDSKESYESKNENLTSLNFENSEISTENLDDIPNIYGILPTLPLILVIIISFIPSIKIDVFTANVIGIVVAMIFEFIRKRDSRKLSDDLTIILKAIGNSFSSNVMLIIAAAVFADGIIGLGGVNVIANALSSFKGAKLLIIFAMSLLSFLAVILLGSGNASWFAFGPLIPGIAKNVGLNAHHIAVPMQLSASIGRGMSPVASATIAVTGMAKVDLSKLIKRCMWPLIVGFITNLIASYILLVIVGI